MPNHTYNSVKIEHKDPQIVERVKAQLFTEGTHIETTEDDGKDNPFDFNQVIPMPKGLINDAYCAWAREHWSTKWNSYYHDGGWGDGGVENEIHFSTAWSPPIKIMEELSRQWDGLEITMYSEDEDCSLDAYEMVFRNGGMCDCHVVDRAEDNEEV